MNIIDMLIGDIENAGVFAISVVENPAIEEDFVFLNKQEELVRLSTQDDEKRLLLGAALIPDITIPRLNADGSVYQIRFSKEVIREAAELFAINGFQSAVTLEHEKNVDGLCVVESWIIEDEKNDKSRKYGMNLPVGTWMVSMKVLNDEIWTDYVKSGKVKGFSIEGKFTHAAELSVVLTPEEEFLNAVAEVLQADLSDEEMLEQLEQLQHHYDSKKCKCEEGKDCPCKKKISLESYSDYPDAVSNNAKRGIELNEKVNNRCATQVGKVRAQQLAQGEAVSLETIKRMYSYLSRAEEYYDESDTEACGTISYLLWGGLAGKRWAASKLRELGELE